MTPASFQRPISSQEQPSSRSTSSVCAPASCAPRSTVGGAPSNCTGLAHTRTVPGGRGRVEEIAVRLHLRIVGQVERALERAPDALGRAKDGGPLVPRLRGEVAAELRGDLLASGLPRLGRRVALEQVPPPDRLREVRPEALGLEHHEDDPLAVLAAVVPDQRVRDHLHLARRRQHGAVGQRRDDVRREHPHGDAEERDVDLDALAASARAGRAPAATPPAMHMPPMKSPKAGRWWTCGWPGVDRRSAMPPRAQKETPS